MSKFDQLWQRNREIRPQEHAENGCSKARLEKNRELPSKKSTNQTSTDNTKEFTKRWVKNLSSTPLTEAQFSLLAHGPNFAIAPRHPPHWDYITAIEQACLKLEPHNAEKLRAAMRGALRNSQQPTNNNHKTRNPGIGRTQEGPRESHPHGGQGSSHSYYGQGRLPR